MAKKVGGALTPKPGMRMPGKRIGSVPTRAMPTKQGLRTVGGKRSY